MIPRVFISYRREDSAGHAARIAERLRAEYDEGVIFFDVEAIAPGAPFPEVLRQAVCGAEVVIAVICGRWLSCEAKSGIRRIDMPGDWVCEELRLALEKRESGRECLVIPVLVARARMPEAAELPEAIRALSTKQAISFPEQSDAWSNAHEQLLRRIDEVLEVSPEERDRDWMYDMIANRLKPLSEKSRRLVSTQLSNLDGVDPSAGYMPRALAKRFYRIGPKSLKTLRTVLSLDSRLLDVLECLKDYWVDGAEAKKLANIWGSPNPHGVAIVQGEQSDFTPACVVQKANNGATDWMIKQAVSPVSQPSVMVLIEDIHAMLRQRFMNQLHQKRLPDAHTPEVTEFLRQRLKISAESGDPIAVQLDETSAADDELIKSVQRYYPYLRLLILAPGDSTRHNLEKKYLNEIVSSAMAVVQPERSTGAEGLAAFEYAETRDVLNRG